MWTVVQCVCGPWCCNCVVCVCAQMCPSTGDLETVAVTRQLIAQRMSAVRSAMPLFTHHLQLPLFTGQRRWHTMFGQLTQLTSSRSGCCPDTATLNMDEDILADSNLTSLFDTSTDNSLQTPRDSVTLQRQTSEPSHDNTAMDLTEDRQLDVVDRRNTVCRLSPLTNSRHGRDECLASCQSLAASTGSQSRPVWSRRHSDPGSIHSSTAGSSSTSSNSGSWYYYDRRLRPGGALAAQYGRLGTRRSLSVIMLPPAYDDVVHGVPVSTCTDDQTCIEPAGPTLAENSTELPPPYQESERPPSYSEETGVTVRCEPTGDDSVLMTRCSQSQGLFTGRPAVRWNRNTRVERWTSSFNWVMS